ncbi:MAG: Gfo/Idh/MocA family oxidoreductase [Spirochaetaceae bacterium]|jgi:predicted dehydrogenase|nr:Gfo/Idh/MocA family oxidoreductase [Spirochaetaceae bacterium]
MKQRIGIVGIGSISSIYLKNLTSIFAGNVQVTALADPNADTLQKVAEEFSVPSFPTAQALIASPEVDIVLNLTPPKAHFQIALDAVKAGKHIYNEKPLCITRLEAEELLKHAAEHKVRVGCAPDTFLGAGIQTAGKVIKDGWIGRPLAATACMMNAGPESWHPKPEFFYKNGGGPLFDVGPYYLTALVTMLGPVLRVSGAESMPFKSRTIKSMPRRGATIAVEVPTHSAAMLEFAGGLIATMVMSFDVPYHSMPRLEIYGSEGTLRVPDPNTFGGPLLLRRADSWVEMPLIGEFTSDSRGLGISEMAEAINEGRPHRASGKLAYHVLDIMHGIHEAASSGRYYKVKKSK